MLAAFTNRAFASSTSLLGARTYVSATVTAATPGDRIKVLVIGGGTGGLSVANQVYDRFKSSGKRLNPGDVAIVDAAEAHFYQPGWTLAGSGLRPKTDFHRPLDSLIPKHIKHIPEHVAILSPESSTVTTTSGLVLSYDSLVVAAGLQINWGGIKGLSEALAHPLSGVSSVYSYNTCDKVWEDIESLRSGNAVFTQPAGIIKCAGGPQKIMWMAWDRFRRTGRGENIKVDFYTGMPSMFSVKKYSDALNDLRLKRSVGGHFQSNLIAVDHHNRKATFKLADGTATDVDYTTLHAVPPMGPHDLFKGSSIADTAGWISVDNSTLQHTKPEFANVFALGDCSSLPTSKTAAAITAQAPVLVENLFSFLETGKVSSAVYNGYTSCPLLTGYGELMLAEFKYGLEVEETFGRFFDQSKSNSFFYHLKKDIFPAAYWNLMVKGKWFGRTGIFRPSFR